MLLPFALPLHRTVSCKCAQSRLKNRNYPTIQKFVDDVNAIFDNAMYYNEEHSQVWEDAKVLKVSGSSLCLAVIYSSRALA